MGLWNDIAGVADHAAGSVDESIGRQFDNEPGGGIADYDTIAGIGDHLAGSVDESIGRQFDNEPGGGFADETANQAWATTAGLGDWLAGDLDESIGQTTRQTTSIAKYALPATAVGIGVLALASAADNNE